MIQHMRLLTAAAVSAAVTVWDIADRRVPNGIIAAGFLFGIPACGDACSLFRCTAALCLLWPFWRLKLIGGGDVKYLALMAGLFLPADYSRMLHIGFAAAALMTVPALAGRLQAAPRDRREYVPLAAAMALGACAVILEGGRWDGPYF